MSAAISYGIEIEGAGTLQERYFMILAGLLEKNLEALNRIESLLEQNSQSSAPGKTGSGDLSGETIAGHPAVPQPSRPAHFEQSRKSRR